MDTHLSPGHGLLLRIKWACVHGSKDTAILLMVRLGLL
jgi:hypothetical protein